jgi:putative ABC transport system substrate-binding protein
MTGITFMALELSAKRVEVLKELVPAAKRVALLSNPEHAGELEEYRVTEDTAHRLGMSIVRYLVRDAQALAGAYSRIALDRPDAMIVFPDSLTLVRRADITAFAARERIPTIYGWTEFAVAGGLASYGAGVNDNFKSLAKFVDKVLKGESASVIPIEQMGRISLTLNAKTAKAMGFAVPGVIALRADRIIE